MSLYILYQTRLVALYLFSVGSFVCRGLCEVGQRVGELLGYKDTRTHEHRQGELSGPVLVLFLLLL